MIIILCNCVLYATEKCGCKEKTYPDVRYAGRKGRNSPFHECSRLPYMSFLLRPSGFVKYCYIFPSVHAQKGRAVKIARPFLGLVCLI